MTTSAAHDEFTELLRDKHRDTRHPEDRHDDSDHSAPASPTAHDDYYLEKPDTDDDELDVPTDMRSNNYYMPAMRSEANTGPKGVIADAQAFEQAKKRARRFTWKKGSPEPQFSVKAWRDDKAASDDDEDSFMKEWRATRLRELQNVGQKIRSRTNSPTRRIYGNMPLVDAEGYLDAIDKTSQDTTVCVFICDPETESQVNVQCEAYMRDVAQRNDTVRFVKLRGEDAEMPTEVLPAVLAYKAGKKIATLLPILHELPKDSVLSTVSLENCLRRERII